LLKNTSESFDGAQDERRGFDIKEEFSVVLSLSKHEALEAFRTFIQQPVSNADHRALHASRFAHIPNTADDGIEKEVPQSMVLPLCSIRRRGFTQDMRWRDGFSRILEYFNLARLYFGITISPS
jgi:hypothetical protein